ncbi:MAG: RIP metalloprotease RseP [Rhodospirillum sp.]|nr:RIP metalloprotease RseP [Rhodospirillum sp.]MCF8488453.1 RIP metalloprotease RseP [Rhodospirillum sp.]MCF8499115.1 RIP metalloprotease RseP [Rhodospirillum sp.]
MLDLLHTLVSFVCVLTVVVFVHEMGHFLVARWNGVKVEVFSIGFGKELFGFNDRHGTRWRVSAIPMGGYVRFFGDSDATSTTQDSEIVEEMSDADKAVSFHHKRLGQRFSIVVAGPVSNFLFAMVVFAGFFMVFGQPRSLPIIGEVLPGSAAEEGGMVPGDLILSIDGTPVERFQDVQRLVPLSNGTPMTMVVRRDGGERTLAVTPHMVDLDDGLGNTVKVARIGIQVSLSPDDMRRLDPLEAVGEAVNQTWSLSADTLTYLGQMVMGDRSTDELGGPVRIARFSGKAAERGFADLVMFVALLSVNLGLINLFPIPMLDGGHLMFYTLEALRGRPLTARVQEYGFRVGLGLVLALMVFATWNDLSVLTW